MTKLAKVSSVLAGTVHSPMFGSKLFLAATGTTPTTGWSRINLSQHFYLTPPQNGVWEFDLIGDPPIGIILDVEVPYSIWGLFTVPFDLKGVRVIAELNSIIVTPSQDLNTRVAGAPMLIASHEGNRELATGNTIFQQDLASFSDSIQPIGFCSFPAHPKMKKLNHTLTLTIEGPDQGKIQQCLQQATAAGLVAAIVAVYATGGLALSAAVSAFISALGACLTSEFSVRVDDRSHWEEWCV